MTRSDELLAALQRGVHLRTDRMFQWLLLAQWLLAIGLAVAISPYGYDGGTRHVHFHVIIAIAAGGAINVLPIALIRLRPGWWLTRHVVAATQTMWSALLIMVTGGRIETHFHVFVSLAFVAFYRDWKLIVTATLVVIGDHLARGLWWPDSVYGIANPEWWRFLEHGAWVTFEDVVLVFSCLRQSREMRAAADREAFLEDTKANVEREVENRTHELVESADRYRALVETTAAIPFEWDRERGAMRYVAPQLATLLGCSQSRFAEPHYLTARMHPDDVPHIRDRVDGFIAGDHRPNEPIDLRMVSLRGDSISIRLFLSAATDAGRVVRGVMLDTTTQRQLEADLHQAQKLEAVGRLAAGVAHEINTPIQYVGDSISFIRDSVDQVFAALDTRGDEELAYLAEEYPRALDRALDGIGRVAAIVRSMRMFAHPDQGEQLVDLNAAIDSTLTIARNEYKYVADVTTDYGELPQVQCRGGEINQVILNLVVNAAHAIAEVVGNSGRRGTIGVATRVEGGDVVISIADTGGGIPDTIRDQIYDPFFTTKPIGHGTGQGLAIARSVVDKHAGSLTFDTTVGSGTTFHVRIPIAGDAAGKVAA